MFDIIDIAEFKDVLCKNIPTLNHTFHIPVMGLSFTVDTPLKVAKYGITSVVSIIEDNLIEKMRMHYCLNNGIEYLPINQDVPDHRAKRIEAYLNIVDELTKKEFDEMLLKDIPGNVEIKKYVEMMPEDSELRILYNEIIKENDLINNIKLQAKFISLLNIGRIDVNIMTKCDNPSYDKDGNKMPDEFSDAHSALRGFAKSNLESSVIFSAGLNPRLYSYCATFDDFFPDNSGHIKKKVIIKVSDYRSAYIQGKFLAKKGLIVSEFRVESGLNCGGHAFVSDGALLGPVMEEFKANREKIRNELINMCNDALRIKGKNPLSEDYKIKLSVQGGVGTSAEHKFLLDYYGVDSVGWGSPFLLVPEATTVDDQTRNLLAEAKQEDYYLSNSSPLGIRINNFRRSTSIMQIKQRIAKNKPGSPCIKKFLAFNTEFSEKPLCVASRTYQKKKIKSLKDKNLDDEQFKKEYDKVVEKECLCEGLSVGGLITYKMQDEKRPTGVAVCPGPNLAYFNGTFTLKQIIDHIYGRASVLKEKGRSNMFVNEINLNIKYYKEMLAEAGKNTDLSVKMDEFKANLLKGIQYYREKIVEFINENNLLPQEFLNDLSKTEMELAAIG